MIQLLDMRNQVVKLKKKLGLNQEGGSVGKDDQHSGCLPGSGCSVVIEMREGYALFMAEIRKSHEIHASESQAYWDRQKETTDKQQELVDAVVNGLQKAALQFNSGAHRMKKNEDDLNNLAEEQRELKLSVGEKFKDHEVGKYGAHSAANKSIGDIRFVGWGLVIWMFIVTLFVAGQHPEFFEALLDKVKF